MRAARIAFASAWLIVAVAAPARGEETHGPLVSAAAGSDLQRGAARLGTSADLACSPWPNPW